MSYDICGAEWIGKDDKPHRCVAMKHHADKCECDCGERARVVNKLASWEPKPFYKRQKTRVAK